MNRKPRAPDDRVSPELRSYVLHRDRECVVAKMIRLGELEDRYGSCRTEFGSEIPYWSEFAFLRRGYLDAAHIRDRGRGGRIGKRPASTKRRLAACCPGHHRLELPVVDREEVRDVVDAYLEDLEGPEAEDPRWWEVVQRVRGPDRGARLIVPSERKRER